MPSLVHSDARQRKPMISAGWVSKVSGIFTVILLVCVCLHKAVGVTDWHDNLLIPATFSDDIYVGALLYSCESIDM